MQIKHKITTCLQSRKMTLSMVQNPTSNSVLSSYKIGTSQKNTNELHEKIITELFAHLNKEILNFVVWQQNLYFFAIFRQ